MSSFYVVCSPTNAPATDSFASFEAWLTRRFPNARVIERHASQTRAVVWEWSRSRFEHPLDGSISEDRAAIYLRGDLELVCETAVAAVELFAPGTDVVFVNDSQGIVFDLRRAADAAALVAAVVAADSAFAWQAPGDIPGR